MKPRKRRNENLFNENSNIFSENEIIDSILLTEGDTNKEEEIDKELEFNNLQKLKLENIKTDELIIDIKNPDLEDNYSEKIDISCPLFKENNFILSEKSIEKCNKVYHYMIYQVPCILEGETGTSKSFTASMMAKYRQWKIIEDEKKEEQKTGIKKEKYTEFKYIKFSLSKETKISDLFGKYSGDSDSLGSIKMIYGPFIEAFSSGNGHCLHLDEINLAPVSVLQCIEEALDTGVLSIEITGLPLKKFSMKPNFCLIATQNKRTKFYKDKREFAGIKFLSKFQIVNFEEFSKNELLKIAKGIRDNLFENKGRFMEDTDIEKLINFHLEWSKTKSNDFICFTLRQIYSCIEAFSKLKKGGEEIYDIIYNIYGKTHEQQQKFEEVIQKYFKKSEIHFHLPKDFPDCFKTDAINKVFQQVNFSFKNGSNVIIIGKKGCGKTQFALWMAEYYNKTVDYQYGKKDVDFMICTEETSCADLIGKQKLSRKKESRQPIIEWENGFLLKGIKNGKCLVFDCINEISSQVTERANNLFDLNLNSNKKLFFEVPENPNKTEQIIEIKKTFRVLAVCDEEKLIKMSPAFINRFKIIYFEDQLIDLDIKKFIAYKIDRFNKKNKSTDNIQKKENNGNKSNRRKNPRKNQIEEQYNEEEKNEVKNNNNISKERKGEKENIIQHIYEKLNNDNKKIINTMSFLNFFIESILIFKSKFEILEINIIVDFIFQLIDPNCKDFLIDESINEKITNILKEKKKNISKYKGKEENNFFFTNSKELCTFLTKAYSSYLIHLHMRFEGPTGIGKTAGACALAKMIMGDNKYYIQSFHSGTKPSQCFGRNTIADNDVSFKEGLLTLAMEQGSIFIADEFNLSSSETMKSLVPSLTQFREYKIYIPGLEKPIQINENFIFIACQNKVGTLGRNQMPPLIEFSLKELIYPSHIRKTFEEIKIIEKDVQNICMEINNSFYNEYDEKNKEKNNIEAQNVGEFMLKFNQLDKNYIQPLSFRDIKKIFKRIFYQKKNEGNFIGFKTYHNVIFYIISKLNKKNIADIKNNLIILIQEVFKLKGEEDLDCYFENYITINKNKKGTFLQKGLCKINLDFVFTERMKKRILSFVKLQNFLNPLFNAIISSDEESLLFLGKTSCKTFLCETLLQENPEIINLNQETKVDQLLGGPVVLSKEESKIFYFKYLCYICGKSHRIAELLEKYKNNTLKKDMFIQKDGIKGFNYAVEKFKNILFKEENKIIENNNEEDIFSEYIIEFKPGFILDALLKDRPFILKNISNLYSDVLERFNQFLTEEQKIILVEDIYDTFTNRKNKEVSFFNSLKKSRVFATANSGYESKLSEAILSRFSVINVENYEEEEEKAIIDMVINDQKNKINKINKKKEIDDSMELLKKIEMLLNITITLAQKIKIINIILELKKKIIDEKLQKMKEKDKNKDKAQKEENNNDDKNEVNINPNGKEIGNSPDENINFVEIILFNLFKGLFEFRSKKSKNFQKFRELFKTKKYLWRYEENKSTLIKKVIDGKTVIKSKNTYMFIEKSDANVKDTNDIAFTEQFCENIDIIHTSMNLNIPLILEGEQGQGKKTSLKYVFDLLNIKNSNIINIYLTENTKNEDLLGKITATTENNIIKVDFIQTDLLKALIGENNDKYVIIFHNINKASPGIFEILENIFDYNKEYILLPNGENKMKNSSNPPYLFGIFDSENGKINRNSLPNFLLRSCIYFIVQNPNGEDIQKIITTKFKNKKYYLESNYFEDKFLMATQIQNNYSSSNNNPLSLNDINKFISFRDHTYSILDISIISQFIFVYRHTDNEKIQEIINKLQFKAFNFIPKFSFIKDEKFRIEIEEKESNIKEKDPVKFDSDLKNNIPINQEEIIKKFNTLTLPQKHCLLFLFCSIKTKCSIILQGNTNSGKTHLITLFANILGQKLNIYQMNKDISSTMFFGQSMIRKLTDDENKDISKLCTELSVLIQNNNEIKDWNNPNNYNELCKCFSEMDKENKNYNKAKEIFKKIKDKISLTKRFEPQLSPFCEALEKGYWILIEQIESAPNEIIEKLIPLCGDNPELKIIKGTKEVTYKRNSKNNSDSEKKIDDNFRIFFTFNPYNNESKINSSLFGKCVVFTLPQVDSTLEYSANLYYGGLKNINYPFSLSKDISSRLSNVHKTSKIKLMKDKTEDYSNFSHSQIYTGRTIKFILNELTNIQKNKMKDINNINSKYLANIIKSTFKHYYYNSFDTNDEANYNLFKNKIINSFEEKIEIKLETGDDDLENLYPDIYNEIKKIQKIPLYRSNKEEEDEEDIFILSYFWNDCLTIKSKHLKKIIEDIQKIYNRIENSYNKTIILGDFQGIFILKEILNEISQSISSKNFNPNYLRLIISDSILLKNENTRIPCTKLILYAKLLKDKFIITNKTTPEGLVSYIFDFFSDRSFENFHWLIFYLFKFPYLFERFYLLFPFNEFLNENELIGEKENDEEKEVKLKKILKNHKNIALLWIELFYIYYKNKISFNIQIDNNFKYSFKDINGKNNSIINPLFIFNKSSGFYLVKDSYFNYIDLDRKNRLEKYKIEKVCRFQTYTFYQFLLEFSNYNKYVPTSKDIDVLFDDLKTEEEELELFKKFKDERKYFFNTEGIFSQNKNITPVIKILSLFFNYSDEFSYLIKTFSETEKKIYELLLKDLDKKLLKNDYIIYSELVKVLNIYFKNNIDLFDDNSNVENLSQKERNLKLEKINKSLINLKEIKNKFGSFKFEYFFDILQNKKQKIEDINKENQNMILKENIINDINHTLDDKCHDNSRIIIEGIKKKINNLKNDKKSNNILKFWKEKVSNINEIKTEDKSDIKWPKIKFSDEKNYNNINSIKHRLFIDIIMKYSEIKQILNKLDNGHEDNILNILINLSKYEEMSNICNYVFNKIDFENCNISSKNKRKLNSVLNCYVIKSLGEYCYNQKDKDNDKDNIISFKMIQEMFDYFNNTIKREIKKDEIYYIIKKYSWKYKSNFKITFPKFSGMDFVYLFIDINNESEPINGYLMNDIKIDHDGLDDLNSIDIPTKDKNSFVLSLNDIGRIIFEKLGYNNNEEYNEYIDKLKFISNLQKKLEKNDKNKSTIRLCKIMNNLYNEKELDILNKKYEFDFDDIEFREYIDNYNYLEKQIIYNKYPSLIYFLTENNNFIEKKLLYLNYEDNKKIYDKNKNNYDNSCIPFWLLCLRYYSSMECIISKEKNYFSQLIDNNIKSYLSVELNSPRISHRKIGIKWLNMVCSNKRPQFFEKYYEKIKKFFDRLSKDEYLCNINDKSFIKKRIDYFLNCLIKDILSKIFKDNSLINCFEIKENNNIVTFLKNPNKYLYENIKNDIIEELSCSIDKKKEEMNRIIINIEKVENIKENDLKIIFEKELKEKNEDYKELNTTKNTQLLKNLSINVQKYNSLVDDILSMKMIGSQGQNKIKDIVELYDSLSDYELFLEKEEKTETIKISYSFMKNHDIIIQNSYYDEIISENKGISGELYIFEKQLNDIIFKNKVNGEILNNFNKNEKKFSLYFIRIKEKEILENNKYNNIELVFGNGIPLGKFYKDFSIYKNNLLVLKENLLILLKKQDLFSNCQNFNKYKKGIKDFISLCFVKYSDDSKCLLINNSLNELKKILEQINTDYNSFFNILNDNLNDFEVKKLNSNKKILQKDYELKEVPKNIIVEDFVDFSEINNNDSLSIPIINVDSQNHEISCCFNRIECNIGPIYPSLYSESYRMNILTFSNKNLFLKISDIKRDNKNDDIIHDSSEYLINFKEIIKSNMPIEIEIKLPKIQKKLCLKEIHLIEFNLEIECQKEDKDGNKDLNNKSLILPFEIKFELIPIILKFSTKNNKIIRNDYYFSISENLYTDEEISFTLEQIDNLQKIDLKPFIQIEGLENNNSKEPNIIICKDNNEKENQKTKIKILIPNNGKEKSKMNIYVNIYFTENYKIPILIDSIVSPFDYSLLLFDYNDREFKEENCVIKYNFENNTNENIIFKVFLKIELQNGFIGKYIESEFFVENKFENCFEILNIDEISNKKQINHNFTFEIKIKINNKQFPENEIPQINFISIINKVKKGTDIIFIKEKNEFENIYDIKIDCDNQNLEINEKIYYCVENLGILLNLNDNKLLNYEKEENQNKVIDLRRNSNNKGFYNNNLMTPKIKDQEGLMSIKEIEDFYSKCIKVIRALPSSIYSSIVQKDKNKLEEAEHIFCEIYQYFKNVSFLENDNSILNDKINEFKRSFVSLVKTLYKSNFKLKQSNIDDLFRITEYELLNDDTQSDYIIKPIQKELNIPKRKNEKYLRIKEKEKDDLKEEKDEVKEEKNDIFNLNHCETPKYLSGNFSKIPTNINLNIDESIFNREDNEEENNQRENEKEYQDTNNFFKNYNKIIKSSSLKNINLGNKEYINKLKEEEEKEKESIIPEKNEGKDYGYIINEDLSKTLKLEQDKFETYDFSNNDGINWVIKKISKIEEENNHISLLNIDGYLPEDISKNYKNRVMEYPILRLSNYFLKLASKIFNEVSKLVGPDTKTDILFNKTCVILLIDNSCYINKYKKLENFHLLCSFSIALNLLEIPYGIAVIADGKFKVILKQFEEPHSYEILEKVYECLMIRRFRDNLSNSQKFAKETYMFSKEYKKPENLEKQEKPKFYEDHPKKVIITITDGLDEELKLTKEWNNLIFNDPNTSFGFIFYKPDFENNNDKMEIEKLWTVFIEESKKANSKVIINIIDKDLKINLYEQLPYFLRDLIGQKKDILQKKENFSDYEPNFIEEKIILNSIESLENISFKERKGNKIKNLLYIKNYPLKYSLDDPIMNNAFKFDKNKLGNICQGKVNENITKNYNKLIDNFILKNSEIDKMSLEKIFKKNKASQKVLSTTGSEIDIVSLIISILNKEPRPKIFWEESGEMKRRYSVSIIIDNSISCFGDISRVHSFQTIRELLSPLLYLEISKLDIILTTNNSPIILCSDINSQKCLRKESTFWIGLFKYLQVPYYGSNLSSAINFIYNLNKERNEFTKIVFVLTDGLFEKNEQMYISKQIHNCAQLDINIIGIGIGSYPIGIENIFEKIIYTIDPSNLLLGLSGFFEQIHTNTTDKMLGFEYQAKLTELKGIIEDLSKIKKIYFNNLIKELKKIEVNYTTFDYFNKPVILENHFKNLNEVSNPLESEKTLLLKKNSLKGQKILIVMLWSYDLNPSKESPKVIPDNLFRSGKMNIYLKNDEIEENKICVESAVNIFGIDIFVVLDYENAIKELTKNIDNKCIYNSVWVMCGPQKAVIPNPKSDPNLIGEFMEVIKAFWMNGGSIVFFADGDPLFYQVNLFLKNAEFPIFDEDANLEEEEIESSLINKRNAFDYDFDSNEQSIEFKLNNEKKNKIKNIFQKEDEETEKKTEREKIEVEEEEKSEIEIKEENEKGSEESEEERESEEEENEDKISDNKDRISEENIIRNKKIRVNFKIDGSHKGGQTLDRDDSGLLEDNKTFNASNEVISNLKRPNIGNNLLKIYEGITVSYAVENNNDVLNIFNIFGLSHRSVNKRYGHYFNFDNPIYPFIPFAKDSEGGISIMIYYGRGGCGDIVIDCGFTKCFIEMEEEGTFRYIRNLSALTSRCDVLLKNGKNPKLWKPKAINYKLNLSKNYFWKDFKRKIYIIDVDSPVSENDKTYIYDIIKEELYSTYNNIIYFINNDDKVKIDIEDINKNDSLIPNNSNQANLKKIAYDILEECNHKFENNYFIEIFSDGISSRNDNKVMDYILSCEEIPYDKRSFQLLPEANTGISKEFIFDSLKNLENIKSFNEFSDNYKNIRNSLLFSYFDYTLEMSQFNIKREIDRIENAIKEEINEDEKKLNILKEKMEILIFYSNVEIENFGINAAAFQDA